MITFPLLKRVLLLNNTSEHIVMHVYSHQSVAFPALHQNKL